jgi:predicted permease
MIDMVLQDIRLALRTLAKAPTFTAAVMVTIALGVGATTAIFTVVDAILLRPLPFPDSEQAVVLCETNPAIGDWCGASPMNVADWARASRTLDSAGVARTEPLIVRASSENYGVIGGIASPGFFRVLRLRPMLGRLIEDRDMDRRTNHVVMVSNLFWQRRLGADLHVVGREIVLDEQPFTIVGVLPADAYVPGPVDHVEVWKPLTASIDNVELRKWRGFRAIGRLARGASPAALRAELETIRAQLAKAYPEANRDWGLRIGGLRKELVGDVSRTLWIFLGAVGLVLLIACANVASLLLVRASGRAPEFAVRASLGARRGRLVQQLVTESLVMALGGGALGLLLAGWATSAFVALAPANIPRISEVGIDGHVILFTFMLSAVTAVIFGAAPARQASKADLNTVLRGNRATGGAGTRLRSALVVVELALALMLLVGAGLLIRTFDRLLRWDPGFDRAGLVTTWMLTPRGVGGGSAAVAVMERVRDEVVTVPGVRAAALGSAGPLFGGGPETGGLEIEGRPPFAPGEMPTVEWFDISRHYFDTLGVRVLRGRGFSAADTASAPPVAVVNDTMARRFFGGQNPIGRRVTVEEHPSEIVGVVADVRPLRPDQPTAPQIYWPIEQYRRLAAYLVLRTTPGIGGIEKGVRARAASVNAGIQISSFESIDQGLARSVVRPRFNMVLVAAFAAVAILLAAVGVYGVIAYAVASRTREIGVHIALGATPRRLVAAIVRRGMTLAAVGIAIGCAGAVAVGRLLSSLLYGLPATDPLTLTAAITLFALVACGACWLPARRASRVDPISALRVE